MGSISIMQWRKAYMLEFLENDVIKECFTFSVPPESEEFQFSQRVSETKTFGGSVFDDYGNDSYRITLTGTTVNEEKKFIYKGKTNAPQYLTGTKEIFELQRIIKKWGDGEVTAGFFRNNSTSITGERKVYLYDLSKMSVLQIASGVASRNYWRVFIKDLKIRRDKSKPKTYNYTLEMIGVEDNTKQAQGLFSSISDVVDGITKTMGYVETVMDLTEATTAAAGEVADHCARVKLAADMVANRDISANLVILNIGSAADLVSRIMSGSDSNSFYNAAKNCLHSVETFKGIVKVKSGTAPKGKIQSTSVYIVTFDSTGGSGVSYQKVIYSNKATKPDNPVKTYYTFAGWFTDEELITEYDFTQEVTESFTLYAKWILAVAKVTYNSRNGSSVSPQYVTVGERTSAPVTPPTRNGYSFDTWCIDYDCTIEFDFNTPIIDNIMLYARWTKTYNVIFNSNNGSMVATQTVTTGGLAVYPKTPTKDNYTFAYWCSDSGLQNVFDFNTPITEDITLYACWIHISNTVTFDSLGGSSVDFQRISIGGHAVEPENPVKTGFDFVYWATDKEGTNEFIFASTPVNTNITLYAKWTESECDVDFDTDGGSSVETQSIKYGGKVVFPVIPTKKGCSFEMWRVKKEVETEEGEKEFIYEEFDFNTPITEDITLYALWFGGE